MRDDTTPNQGSTARLPWVPCRDRERGATFFEMVLATGILALAVGAIASLFSLGSRMTVQLGIDSDLESGARNAWVRMTDEIASSGQDKHTTGSLVQHVTSHPTTTTTTASAITFHQRVGLTWDAALDWTVPITYALGPSGAEIPANTLDDDGDGVVDEQQLLRTQDGTTQAIVDSVTALTFTRASGTNTIDVSLSITRYDAYVQQATTRTLTGSITLGCQE